MQALRLSSSMVYPLPPVADARVADIVAMVGLPVADARRMVSSRLLLSRYILMASAVVSDVSAAVFRL